VQSGVKTGGQAGDRPVAGGGGPSDPGGPRHSHGERQQTKVGASEPVSTPTSAGNLDWPPLRRVPVSRAVVDSSRRGPATRWGPRYPSPRAAHLQTNPPRCLVAPKSLSMVSWQTTPGLSRVGQGHQSAPTPSCEGTSSRSRGPHRGAQTGSGSVKLECGDCLCARGTGGPHGETGRGRMTVDSRPLEATEKKSCSHYFNGIFETLLTGNAISLNTATYRCSASRNGLLASSTGGVQSEHHSCLQTT